MAGADGPWCGSNVHGERRATVFGTYQAVPKQWRCPAVACAGSYRETTGEPDLRTDSLVRSKKASSPSQRYASFSPEFISPERSSRGLFIALWLISGTIGVSRKAAAARHVSACFFRKRLALAIARECQGVRSEVIVALPLPKTSRAADLAAASAFSFAIRRYSAGEQSFCKIKRERRAIVSQDATIKSLIITASDKPWWRLRPFMTDALPVIHPG
jgi:hypothetical protein